MGQPGEAVERRLEPHKQDDRPFILDGQFRAFRSDHRGLASNSNHGSRLRKLLEGDPNSELILAILEDFSRRVESLERNDRVLSDEIRWLNRRDLRRRSLFVSISAIVGSILVCRWIIEWL